MGVLVGREERFPDAVQARVRYSSGMYPTPFGHVSKLIVSTVRKATQAFTCRKDDETQLRSSV